MRLRFAAAMLIFFCVAVCLYYLIRLRCGALVFCYRHGSSRLKFFLSSAFSEASPCRHAIIDFSLMMMLGHIAAAICLSFRFDFRHPEVFYYDVVFRL